MVEKISEFRRQMEDGSVLVFVPKRAVSAAKDGEGQDIVLTYATKAEFQPVKDHAIRDDVTGAQTMAGPLIVGGHDLSKTVTTNEEQKITSVKRISRNDPIFHIENTSVTKGVNPTGARYSQIWFNDKDGNNLASVVSRANKDGTSDLYLFASDVNGSKNVVLNLRSLGYATAPTPNSYVDSAIPTLAYLKYTGQNAVNVGQNLVHTDGKEDIDGEKSVNGRLNVNGIWNNKNFCGRISPYSADTPWIKVCTIPTTVRDQSFGITFLVTGSLTYTLPRSLFGILSVSNFLTYNDTRLPTLAWRVKSSGIVLDDFVATIDSTGAMTLWCRQPKQTQWGISFTRLDESETYALNDRIVMESSSKNLVGYALPSGEGITTVVSEDWSD